MELPQYDVDVVVVGSGMSGTVAALEASRGGANVALLEKSGSFGGSAALSAGMYWTAPSVDAYQKRIPNGNLRLGAHIVEQFDAGLEFLQSLKISVADEPLHNIMTFGVGYSFDVRGFLQKARQEILERGGQCNTDTAVVELLQDDDKRVAGVVAKQHGKDVLYSAPMVILASGGFQGWYEELERHIPHADSLVFRSNPGSTGDGLRLVRNLGIKEVGAMDSFYGHLLPYPLNSFEPEHYLPYSQYYSEATILLNLQGKRFLDETLGDEILNQALVNQPEARGVMIFDDWVRKNEATSEPFPGLGKLDRMEVAQQAGGHVAEAQTLEGLFDQIQAWGLNRDIFTSTVEKYISAIAAHTNEVDGIAISPKARPPRTGPFYAIMVQPSITFTFGGIPIDNVGHVLSNEGKPVPGLYAAGADVGGISATGYAGGLAPAVITGMSAGATASQELLAQTSPTIQS